MFSDQIGLTPEEVISKIMQNPDVAMAFQNPRVQAALMEVRFILSLELKKKNLFDMSQLNLIVVVIVVAVFREPNEHHEVPKRQRGKSLKSQVLH